MVLLGARHSRGCELFDDSKEQSNNGIQGSTAALLICPWHCATRIKVSPSHAFRDGLRINSHSLQWRSSHDHERHWGGALRAMSRLVGRRSMSEVAHSGEDHGEPRLVGSLDHFL